MERDCAGRVTAGQALPLDQGLRPDETWDQRLAAMLQRVLLTGLPPGGSAALAVGVQSGAVLPECLVGGDFVDAFAHAGNRVALVLGHVSGKGLSAAVRIPAVKYAPWAFLHERPCPADALGRVNRFLCASAWESALGEFVTLAAAVVGCTTGRVYCAGAGAEPPLILRVSGAVETVNACRMSTLAQIALPASWGRSTFRAKNV